MTLVADLAGHWRAAIARDDLAKRFADPQFDDSDWPTVSVPGHWRSHADFALSDGPVLHRRAFEAAPSADARTFLELDGVFYFADVWLDGEYVAATDGYFVHHAFEVTELLRAGTSHTLAVEVVCPPQTDRTAKRIVTGVFSHWDCLDPTWNPGGIWQPVRITASGPARFARCRVLCTEASETRGRLTVDATVDIREPEPNGDRLPPLTTGRVCVTVNGPVGDVLTSHDEAISLAAGENQLTFEVIVENPPRWWPWRMGDQPLCTVDAVLELDGVASDRRHFRTAFREVHVEDWIVTVNGQRLFAMGTNLGPTRPGLADASVAAITDDLRLAREANLDLVRVHAHVGRPELYDRADEIGLLVWQDLPLQWAYAHGVRKQAVRHARAMVDQLGHHPSVAMWCAHNEPLPLNVTPGDRPSAAAITRLVASMELPTWNKDVLDRSVSRAIRRADTTRVVVRHSGVFPGTTSTGTDSHLYFGWYLGAAADLAPTLARWPRLARFVSEFGAQAVPDSAAFMEPDRWPDLDWRTLAEHHGLQRFAFDRYVPPEDFPTFDAWRAATQAYQRALVQLQIEDLRRLRFSPTGGFCQFLLADSYPAVTWSVVDHARVPKPAYGALQRGCRSILPMLDPRTGVVHVANEERRALRNAAITITVDGRRWRFAGNVGADAVTHVGTVEVAGARRAEIVLESAELAPITNGYDESLFALVGANSVPFRHRE